MNEIENYKECSVCKHNIFNYFFNNDTECYGLRCVKCENITYLDQDKDLTYFKFESENL